MNLLEVPCTYQGGKKRIAKFIVDEILKREKVDENTIFVDLCCGSGAISIEMINRGFNPNNILMVDKGDFGKFWSDIANDSFNFEYVSEFCKNNLSRIENIQSELKNLSTKDIKSDYWSEVYILLQSGSFGGKCIYSENGKWKNNSFRSYWKPTETSNRKSVVNPMMPMPNTLLTRLFNIKTQLGGIISALHCGVEDVTMYLDDLESRGYNLIIYCDPPYKNTTGYGHELDIRTLLSFLNNCNIYISEGFQIDGCREHILISEGREKGNISGEIRKEPTQEWLNIL